MSVVERTHPRPGVTQLTLTRPESLNSMTAELVQELHDHLDAIAVDADVRVVILTGAGPAEQVMGNAQAAIDLENRQQIMASATRDHREAMVAFVERRPPDFTNS